MRLAPVSAVLLALAAGACGSRGSAGPAWPKMAEAESDGGESIAPRQHRLPEREDKPKARDKDDTAATSPLEPEDSAAPPKSTPAAPTAPSATAPTSDEELDEELLLEEMVIEVEDDLE